MPFFSRPVTLIPGVPAAPKSKDSKDVGHVEPAVVPSVAPVSSEALVEHGGDRSSMLAEFVELGPEDAPIPRLPVSAVKARESALSLDHQLTHYPKNPTCDICNRARLYSRRIKARRPIDEAVDLPKAEAFGQQLACDHLIVFKSAKGRSDHAVLIVQDCFSKVMNAYPTFSREASQLASHLKHFVGLKSSSYTIVKSDAANEILRAVIDNGWLPEPSVPGRFPHNAALEREIRTFQEVCRSVFLQAGFAARPQLWPHACSYVAVAMSAFIKPDDGETRWKAAFGEEFLGPKYLLGQLGFVRTKAPGKSKFSPNAEPAIFVGWRLDFGMRYRGVLYFVLYSHLRESMSSYPVSQFHEEEVYFNEQVTFPLQSAAESALKVLKDPKQVELDDIDSLPVPFVDVELIKKTRRVYITYSRMLKIGATPGCRGCDNDSSAHNAECVARFEKEFGVRNEEGDLVEPDEPAKPELPEVEDVHVESECDYSPSIASEVEGPEVIDVDELPDLDYVPFDPTVDSVPECPPASGLAAILSIASDAAHDLPQEEVQSAFGDAFDQGGQFGKLHSAAAVSEVEGRSKKPKHNKGKHELSGSDVLFEFACPKDSNLGTVGSENGVKVIRLCKENIDLEDPGSIQQLIEQVRALPGCSIHGSIECKPWSQWQRLNEKKHPRLLEKLRKEREDSEALLMQFIKVANICLDQGGDCSFEWPRFCSGWALPCLQEWILERDLSSVTFDGCTVGVEANGKPARKPWRILTSSLRLVNNLAALRCTHSSHEPLQGKWTRMSAFYPRPLCNLIINSLFPHVVNQHVFSMPCDAKVRQSHRQKVVYGYPCMPIDEVMYEVGAKELTVGALVHRLLDRNEWKGRPEALEAIRREKEGLLQEGTWLESEIISKQEAMQRHPGTTHFGSLMVIVSIKGYEKDPSAWKVKARVVFRGDNVRDQDGLAATFQELHASAPSSIAGLNVVMAYSMIGSNVCTTSDCVRAYIQCLLKSKHPTFVLLPAELVPPNKRHIVQPCARLHKALYGHPESSAHWTLHLADVLRNKMNGKEFENMPSVWWFEHGRMMMSVYVDDLTLGGDRVSHPSFWDELKRYINLDPFSEFGRVLGRDHQVLDGSLVLGSSDFARQCISRVEREGSEES